jgi:biopolymer transport protein ExbD
MINVVFLLLTFFIIAGTFHAADMLDVDPPEVAAEGTPSEEGPLILVDCDGVMVLGDETLTREALVARLKQLTQEQKDQAVRLKVDRATRAHQILPLLKALSENGIKQVQMIAVTKPAAPVSIPQTATASL